MRLYKNKINYHAILAFIILLWVYHLMTTQFRFVDEFFLPTLSSLWEATQKMFWKEHFLVDIWYSTARVRWSYILAFIAWLPVALLIWHSKSVRKTLLPYVDFLRYIPVPTLIPISILFFGIGEGSKIFLLFVWTIFQLVLLVLNDLDNIPKAYYYLAHSLWRNKLRITRMKIRAILPELFDNSRIMIWRCRTYVVIAELVAAQHWVWFVIKEAQRFANTPKIYVAIITMWITWFVTDYLLRNIKPLLFPYKKW